MNRAAMPRLDDDEAKGECKDDGAEAKGEAKEGDELNNVVHEFLEYSTSERITAVKQAFFEAHCAGFEDAEELERSGRGHPLEWTAVHKRYLEVFDAELSRFCGERGVSEAALSSALEAITDRKEHLQHVLPVILLTTGYEFFVRNMYDTARAGVRRTMALSTVVLRRRGP